MSLLWVKICFTPSIEKKRDDAPSVLFDNAWDGSEVEGELTNAAIFVTPADVQFAPPDDAATECKVKVMQVCCDTLEKVKEGLDAVLAETVATPAASQDAVINLGAITMIDPVVNLLEICQLKDRLAAKMAVRSFNQCEETQIFTQSVHCAVTP